MALERRIDSLKKRHAEIDTKILAESARPSPDPDLLHTFKIQKLKIKDEVSWLEHIEQQAA